MSMGTERCREGSPLNETLPISQTAVTDSESEQQGPARNIIMFSIRDSFWSVTYKKRLCVGLLSGWPLKHIVESLIIVVVILASLGDFLLTLTRLMEVTEPGRN